MKESRSSRLTSNRRPGLTLRSRPTAIQWRTVLMDARHSRATSSRYRNVRAISVTFRLVPKTQPGKRVPGNGYKNHPDRFFAWLPGAATLTCCAVAHLSRRLLFLRPLRRTLGGSGSMAEGGLRWLWSGRGVVAHAPRGPAVQMLRGSPTPKSH